MRKSDECRGVCCTSYSAGSQAGTQITSTLTVKSSIHYTGPFLLAHAFIAECIKRKKPSKYCFRLQVEKVFLHFPTACKEMLLFWPFWTENRDFFPWCSPDALLSFWGTMTTLEHPAGAPQLGIPRIVLDIFGFHQSKWLQFSIKMLNLVVEPSGQGRKYEAVLLDDKWPSFDWANREIRATVLRNRRRLLKEDHWFLRQIMKWIAKKRYKSNCYFHQTRIKRG